MNILKYISNKLKAIRLKAIKKFAKGYFKRQELARIKKYYTVNRINTLITEFKLIQEKNSSLSRSQRDDVVQQVRELIALGLIQHTMKKV